MARPIDTRSSNTPDTPEKVRKNSAARALRSCAARVRRILGRVAVITEEAEGLELELAAIAGELRGAGVDAVPGNVTGAVSKARAEHRLRGAMRTAAAPGLKVIEMRFRPDRSAIARLDGTVLQLAPGPAAVLSVLARAKSGTDSVFPDLMSRAVFAEALSKEVGRSLSRQAVTELVYRLKVALLDAGLSPFLIESTRSRGIRLRYRAPAAAVTNLPESGLQVTR